MQQQAMLMKPQIHTQFTTVISKFLNSDG